VQSTSEIADFASRRPCVFGFLGSIPFCPFDSILPIPPDPHYRHRFPAAIISHAGWLYYVFGFSPRDVEFLMAERGIAGSHETVLSILVGPRHQYVRMT